MNLFDHLKNITTSKKEYLGDEGWNNWMINRFLSMSQDYIELVNEVQHNTWQLKGEYLYNLYKDVIPKRYVFLKYMKPTNKIEYDDNEIEALKQYFEISGREAKEYMDMISEEELLIISKKIYGK